MRTLNNIGQLKINSLFLILRACSFSYDSGKNNGKKKVVFVICLLFCLRARVQI